MATRSSSRSAAAAATEAMRTIVLSDEEEEEESADERSDGMSDDGGGGDGDASDGGDDPPWRTEGHGYLRRRVRIANEDGSTSIGTVVGWIADTDTDKEGEPGFCDDEGNPACLFHVRFEDGTSQDFEEHELEGNFIRARGGRKKRAAGSGSDEDEYVDDGSDEEDDDDDDDGEAGNTAGEPRHRNRTGNIASGNENGKAGTATEMESIATLVSAAASCVRRDGGVTSSNAVEMICKAWSLSGEMKLDPDLNQDLFPREEENRVLDHEEVPRAEIDRYAPGRADREAAIAGGSEWARAAGFSNDGSDDDGSGSGGDSEEGEDSDDDGNDEEEQHRQNRRELMQMAEEDDFLLDATAAADSRS